ncbi:hypothetical protein QA639_21510 [Bradyrhizobium pachyrhizi]|nr:hypothetical protein [Bradyrhizobium pachyrhizi]WFU52289.1 hypothetical protein QA639_21510 [Bradyrhizobium pachyrhizi]
MIIETIIMAAALYFGLTSIGDAIDNVAVGIEQASLNQMAFLQDDEGDE